MIQRIQTLFLVLAAAASFGAIGMPLATASESIAASALFQDSVFSANDNIVVLVLFAVGAALAVAAVVLFKNRPVQLILSLLAMLANAAGGLWAGYLFSQDGGQASGAQMSWGIILPIVAIFSHVMARRSIRKDEQLVRSMDRLR